MKKGKSKKKEEKEVEDDTNRFSIRIYLSKMNKKTRSITVIEEKPEKEEHRINPMNDIYVYTSHSFKNRHNSKLTLSYCLRLWSL